MSENIILEKFGGFFVKIQGLGVFYGFRFVLLRKKLGLIWAFDSISGGSD
jgi:hypothetical protein